MTNKEKGGRSNPANPLWLKLAVIAFLAYAAYLHVTGQGRGGKINEEAASQAEPAAAALAEDGAAVTSTPEGVAIGGEIQGSGEPASCGQEATVKVDAALPDGAPLEASDEAEILTLHIGQNEEKYPWAAGVYGMRQGGVREVVVPAGAALAPEKRKEARLDEHASIRFKITLERLFPLPERGSVPFRVADTAVGEGNAAACGDAAGIRLTLWGADGKSLYASENGAPLTLRLGEAQAFYGLDRGVIGMRPGGTRTLIVPPAWLGASASGKALQPVREALAGKEAGIVVAEVQLLTLVPR